MSGDQELSVLSGGHPDPNTAILSPCSHKTINHDSEIVGLSDGDTSEW